MWCCCGSSVLYAVTQRPMHTFNIPGSYRCLQVHLPLLDVAAPTIMVPTPSFVSSSMSREWFCGARPPAHQLEATADRSRMVHGSVVRRFPDLIGMKLLRVKDSFVPGEIPEEGGSGATWRPSMMWVACTPCARHLTQQSTLGIMPPAMMPSSTWCARRP